VRRDTKALLVRVDLPALRFAGIVVITGWLLTAGQALLHALLSVLPTVTAPEWLMDSTGAAATVFSAAGSMGVWFPASLLLTVLAGLLTLWLAGFGIKLVRMVASFFTAGGGSAG